MRRRVDLLRRLERQYLRKHTGAMGLQPLEGHMLYFLEMEGQLRQEDIVLKFSIDKGGVARSLARMEELGLVLRQVSDRCRREKLVTLTAAGHAAALRIQQILNDWEEMGYRGFSSEERALYEAFLSRITENALDYKRGDE